MSSTKLCVLVILESCLRSFKSRSGLINFEDNPRKYLFYLSFNLVFKLVASKRELKSAIDIAHGLVFKGSSVYVKCSEVEVSFHILTPYTSRDILSTFGFIKTFSNVVISL